MFIFDEALRKHHYVKYARKRIFSDLCFPYKDKIFNSVPKRENTGRRKPLFRHILRGALLSV